MIVRILVINGVVSSDISCLFTHSRDDVGFVFIHFSRALPSPVGRASHRMVLLSVDVECKWCSEISKCVSRTAIYFVI